MSTRNRMANLENRYQTQARRVLCLCSAGMLRSPTVAWVLSNPPYNFNTRAAGLTTEYALIPVDDALVFWANDVIVMDHDMKCHVEAIIDNSQWKDDFEHPNIFVWKIPDMYDYRQPELISLIEDYAEKEYNIPGLILTKVPDGWVSCEKCNTTWCYNEDDTCPNCGLRRTEV